MLAERLFSIRFGAMLGGRVVVAAVNPYATNSKVNTMTAADCT